MKHECHCGLGKHLKHFRARRLGVVGAVLMVAHILFHVVECLVLPAIVIGISEQTTRAISSEEIAIEPAEVDFDNSKLFTCQSLTDTPSLLTFSETVVSH